MRRRLKGVEWACVLFLGIDGLGKDIADGEGLLVVAYGSAFGCEIWEPRGVGLWDWISSLYLLSPPVSDLWDI